MSCLLTAIVNGWSRVPDPPARMMPFLGLFMGTFYLFAYDIAVIMQINDLGPYLLVVDPTAGSLTTKSEPFALVRFIRYVCAPLTVIEIPLHGLVQS